MVEYLQTAPSGARGRAPPGLRGGLRPPPSPVPAARGRAPARPLIVLDECGRLEQKLPRFRARVLELLDGDTPILGVIRQDASGWLEDIRRHPGVRLVTVTLQNRDTLPQQLAEYYRPIITPAKEEP